MKIFVVIPNWNGADMLPTCLKSLQKQSQQHKVIVVDNGSEDNSVKIIERDFKNVILLQNPKNYGFAGGVNTGIRYALEKNADAIALLNNDAVVDRNWLENLQKSLFSDKKIGIVTSKILRDDKKHLDSTGDFYSVWGIPFPRGRNQIDVGQFDTDVDVFAASGGASVYKAELFKDIGLFDERFFAYYEDVDISFRAQLAGWRIKYEPEAIAYHHIGATSSQMGDFTRYHSIKNFLMLYTKNMPGKLYLKYLPYFLYQFTRTTARSMVDLKLHVWLNSIFSFLIFLPSILKDRRYIQKNKTVTADYIDGVLHKKRAPTPLPFENK